MDSRLSGTSANSAQTGKSFAWSPPLDWSVMSLEYALGVENRFEKTISDLDNDPIDTVEPTTEQALQWLLSHEGQCDGAT
jgi:hypothetical protein